ncbi:uncharacterized protein KIAA1958-like [Ptychodera flava]|uniref:uncharacterized protein KIAA1958-like n=1 Tax=Ptychodera flava TaxID=63121 RepID=UPI00396A80D6
MASPRSQLGYGRNQVSFRHLEGRYGDKSDGRHFWPALGLDVNPISILFGDIDDGYEKTNTCASAVGNEDMDSVNNFVKSQRKVSTVRTTERDVNKVRRFIETWYDDHRELSDIPATALNEYLASFFINMKKDDGRDYEPDSISAVKHSIERYFSEKRYGVSLNDKQFDLANEALKAKWMQLKKRGMGGKRQASEAISPEEENAMWKSGVLGKKSRRTVKLLSSRCGTKNL